MQTNSTIKLSFIVPVYNSDIYLEQCVRSILKCSSQEIELILVNDGSTDSSGSMCDAFSAEDNRVRVIHKQNGGVASARNAGFDHAAGEYVFFIDNDDWVDSEKINGLLATINTQHPDIVFNRYCIVEEGRPRAFGNADIDKQNIENKNSESVLRYLRTNRINIMAPWEYVFRKNIAVKNGVRFNTSQNGVDDSFFSPVLFCCCDSFNIGDEPVYFWRQRPDSQGKSHNKNTYVLKMISVVEALGARLEGDNERTKYLLFSMYKSLYSLFGQYYQYDKESRVILDTWYDIHKPSVKRALEESGFLHKTISTFCGMFFGMVISYRLAVLKSFVYSHLYGYRTRAQK